MEMIVNIDCHGCEKKVRRALENLDGVDGVEIDMELQKVTVTGWAEHEKVLKVVRKTGRSAELWPFEYMNSQCFGFAQQPDEHYNYTHEELASSNVLQGETPFVAFSDDNVNACSIM